MRVPFGYRTDPERPRDSAGLRVEGYEATIVRQMITWYLEREATLGSVARLLMEGGVLTPTGKDTWSRSAIRGILKNPAYVGNAYGHCTHLVPAKSRRSPLEPVGAGLTNKGRPEEEWIPVSVAQIVDRVRRRLRLRLVANHGPYWGGGASSEELDGVVVDGGSPHRLREGGFDVPCRDHFCGALCGEYAIDLGAIVSTVKLRCAGL
jgi:hypothetical protein